MGIYLCVTALCGGYVLGAPRAVSWLHPCGAGCGYGILVVLW